MTGSTSAHEATLETVAQIVERESNPEAALADAVETLAERFEHYSWIGIYLVDGGDLVLGPWSGPQATEHTRIPVGHGICGAAAATGRTEIADDVAADERYLACFASTRSEIVVPIAHEGRVIGEIDIDSDARAAFGEEDRAFLERVAALLSRPAARAVHSSIERGGAPVPSERVPFRRD